MSGYAIAQIEVKGEQQVSDNSDDSQTKLNFWLRGVFYILKKKNYEIRRKTYVLRIFKPNMCCNRYHGIVVIHGNWLFWNKKTSWFKKTNNEILSIVT